MAGRPVSSLLLVLGSLALAARAQEFLPPTKLGKKKKSYFFMQCFTVIAKLS